MSCTLIAADLGKEGQLIDYLKDKAKLPEYSITSVTPIRGMCTYDAFVMLKEKNYSKARDIATRLRSESDSIIMNTITHCIEKGGFKRRKYTPLPLETLYFIHVDPEKMDDIVKSFRKIESVKEVRLLRGIFDGFARSTAATSDEIKEMYKAITEVEGVRNALELRVLKGSFNVENGKIKEL